GPCVCAPTPMSTPFPYTTLFRSSVGLWVSALRTKFRSGKLTAAQIIAAEEIGVRFVPPYRDPKPKPPTRAERQERDFLDKLTWLDRKSTRLNSSHVSISYAVFCL